MSITDWIKDKVEDSIDYFNKKITGNYEHFETCKYCLKPIYVKYGIGDNFYCSSCNIFLCEDCISKYIRVETIILQHPALFKKGRRQFKYRCPE